jgi:hypothetical protein
MKKQYYTKTTSALPSIADIWSEINKNISSVADGSSPVMNQSVPAYIEMIRNALTCRTEVDANGVAYIRVGVLSEGLDCWLEMGQEHINVTDIEGIYKTLTDSDEKKVTAICRELGYKVTRCEQSIECFKSEITVDYLRIKNPANGNVVCLIPWFMSYRKKYPVFVDFLGAMCSGAEEGSVRRASLAQQVWGVEQSVTTAWRYGKDLKPLLSGINAEDEKSKTPATLEEQLASLTKLLSLSKENAQADTVETNPAEASPAEALVLSFAETVLPEIKKKQVKSAPNKEKEKKKTEEEKEKKLDEEVMEEKEEKRKEEEPNPEDVVPKKTLKPVLGADRRKILEIRRQIITLSRNLVLSTYPSITEFG